MSDAVLRRQMIRGCVILLSVICCFFLWTAVLSFDPIDWPTPHCYPHPDPVHNAAGRAGAWIAHYLFVWMGKGVYAGLAGATMAIGVLARQGRLTSLWQRIIGIVLLTAVASTTSHLLIGAEPPLWLELRGGALGFVLAGWLESSVKWMTIPILLYCGLVGVLFTAEGLVMRIPQAIRDHREQLQSLAENVRQAVPSSSRLSKLMNPFQRIKGLFGNAARIALAGVPGGAGKLRGKSSNGSSRASAATGRAAKKATAVLDEDEDALEEIEEECDGGLDPSAADDTDAEAEAENWDEEDAWEGEEEDDSEYEDEDEEEDEEEEYDEDEEDDEDEDDEECELADEEDADITEPAPTPEPPMIVKYARPTEVPDAPPTMPTKPYPTELAAWEYPEITVLDEPEYTFSTKQEEFVREKARVLTQSLAEYRIEANVVEIDTGPVITMYELQVAPGVKVSQISSLANDIARAMKAPSVRVVAPIPGKNTIGIEVPNVDKEKVRMRELMTLAVERLGKMQLPLFLGKDASGNALVSDLAGMPHMLIAGTTGSGKSVCINSIIASILMTQRPDMVKLILVDPKMVEMSMFRDVPHLMCPIVTEMERAEKILEWATVKMDERYALLAEAGVRNIAAYNRLTREEKHERFQPSNEQEESQIPLHLPYIVILIDELADLMMLSAKEVELHLSRLAQKSRAVGIHIIVATQRPEAKIVTGLIKSNLPCRVAFRVASRMDSRIVLDQNGAEVLMGQGDMLYLPPGSAELVRAQGTYLEDAELRRLIGFLKDRGEPEFHPELMQLRQQNITSDGPRDELFDKAVEIVLETHRGSVSLLQRRLTIGYSRASRLIEEMAAAGIVGAYKGSQAREVLITPEQWQAMKEQEADNLRHAVLDGDGVPDDIFDDDI